MSTKSERSERTPRLVPDASDTRPIAEREENSEGRRPLSNHVDDVRRSKFRRSKETVRAEEERRGNFATKYPFEY